MNEPTNIAYENEIAHLEEQIKTKDSVIRHLGLHADRQQNKLNRVDGYLTEYAKGKLSAEMAINYIFMGMGRKR